MPEPRHYQVWLRQKGQETPWQKLGDPQPNLTAAIALCGQHELHFSVADQSYLYMVLEVGQSPGRDLRVLRNRRGNLPLSPKFR